MKDEPHVRNQTFSSVFGGKVKAEDASMLQVLASILLVSHPHSAQVSLGFNRILSLNHLSVNTAHLVWWYLAVGIVLTLTTQVIHTWVEVFQENMRNTPQGRADECPAVNNCIAGKALKGYF